MPKKLIYDIGMNNGDDTAFYLHRGYRVVAVEANPLLVAECQQRFEREIAEGLLVILNIGIAEDSGSFPFWVCEMLSVWSSFDRSIAAREGSSHHKIDIPCRRFQSVLEEFGTPYYLKVDIEGNDALCLKGLQPENSPEYISVEATDVSLLATLRDLGYTRFKCIGQFNFMPMDLPPSKSQKNYEKAQRLLRSRNILTRILRRVGMRQLLEQQLSKPLSYGNWTFPHGSSGPFAENLPGRWQTYEELRGTYLWYKQMFEAGKHSMFWADKGYSFWTDFHARRDD